MDSKQFSFCRQWFEDYTSGFHCSDEEVERNIDLKLQHTYRVCENIKRIASTIGIRGKDQALAEVIALYHDVGRFEQLKVYGTFNDRVSADHSKIALKAINSSGVLSCLPIRERNLVRRCIWYHNKYQLPDSNRADFLLYSRLIRDADKLDILGVIIEHLEKRTQRPNQALDFGMIDEPRLSTNVISDVMQGKMVRISEMRTIEDMRFMYLSWIFDIHYPFTLASIKESGYLEKLMDGLLDDKESIRVKAFLQKYLEERNKMYI
jgi:hypothetical protein